MQQEGTMNKSELVSKMAENAGISQVVAEKALAGALEAMAEALAAGDKISLVGFGTFSTAQREAREGRNPATGKTLTIPAKKVVKFKVGSTLADRVK
ncbi:MAG: HU family DNA-binding protein [Deferrisomatales bacterium]|nr:HU family DNA-binding protein [Deferrisomatales bacterium]